MAPLQPRELVHSRGSSVALQLFVVVQKIIAVALACFPAVAIRFATLVLSMFSSLRIRMALIPALVLIMIRRDDASRGQEPARDQRVKWKPHKHRFSLYLPSIT